MLINVDNDKRIVKKKIRFLKTGRDRIGFIPGGSGTTQDNEYHRKSTGGGRSLPQLLSELRLWLHAGFKLASERGSKVQRDLDLCGQETGSFLHFSRNSSTVMERMTTTGLGAVSTPSCHGSNSEPEQRAVPSFGFGNIDH